MFAGPATVSRWGNVLIIRHKLPDGTLVETLYGHLASFLRTSGNVTRGEQVATIGDGGGLYDAHLHLEVRFSNCPYWGTEGLGYSLTPNPAGWTDPSVFIDEHRPAAPTRPVQGDITLDFNEEVSWATKPHNGVDYSSALENEVISVGDGVVYKYTKSNAQGFGSIKPDGKGPAI